MSGFSARVDSGAVLSSSATRDLPHDCTPRTLQTSILAKCSDGDLTDFARSGSSEAFSVLFQRHHGSAERLALYYVKDPFVAQDLAAEAFVRVLQAIKSGGGPAASFRGYLMTVLRNIVTEWGKAARHQVSVPDVSIYEVENVDSAGSEALKGFDHGLVIEALHSLSERWRTVLWYTVVQGHRPAALSDRLGISPNSVAALTYRAKEGLRQAYLTVHLNQAESTARCAYFISRFAAHSRGKLGKSAAEEVDCHLDTCQSCRKLQSEIREVNELIGC
ncbi:RNA polymerase sigma factor [Streptomyces sp. NPDC056254]|uniref:RNA polymerase sigma factor n=1 Tax=Streptomyces sp. NPDC056254 TaxID=3345763 RepID=UPI0035DA6ED7